MENGKSVNSIIEQIDQLCYKDKVAVYNYTFSLGNLNSGDLNEKLILISLVALATQKMKLKDPKITPIQILMSITGQKRDDSAYYQFLESLSIIVEDFGYNCDKIDSCGCKTSQEIISKIKEILNLWLPF